MLISFYRKVFNIENVTKYDIINKDVLDRFWSKVEKTDYCWNWIGGKNSRGYGVFTLNYKKIKAHRFSYAICYGLIDYGLYVHHICNNTYCVNPSHLQLLTPQEHSDTFDRTNVGVFNALKTHCPRGHEYNKVNTYISKKGIRYCKICDNDRKFLKYYRR